PDELQRMQAHLEAATGTARFVDAVVHPETNAIACVASPAHARQAPIVHARRDRAVSAAVERGPDGLTEREKLTLLGDRLSLALLHRRVTTAPAAHPGWGAERVADERALTPRLA